MGAGEGKKGEILCGPKGGAPKGGALKGGAPKEGLKFRAFCSLSRRNFLSFFSLSGVLSWNFGGVIEGLDPQMCTFGVLGLSCEAPAAPKPPGFHTTARDPNQNSMKRPPREEERMEIVAGEGKKRAKFWAVRRRVSGGGGRGVWRRGSQGKRPNLGRTHENFEHTPHRHTTPQQQHTGWSWARGVPRKEVHGPKNKT